MAHRLCRIGSFLLVALLFLFPSLARGQARSTGQLSGVVVDPSGAAVPNASLTLSEAAVGFATTVMSNESGQYVFPDLQPGSYVLKVSAKGFSDAVLSDVMIATGRTADVKVQMKIGSSSETVEVSASSQVLETTTNTLATTINPESIQDLPLNGRDVLPFAQLVAGAQRGGDQRFTTYNSLPNGAINITVDGMNDNFQRYRSSTTGFFTASPLRVGAMDEMTVATGDLTADAGAEGGVTLGFTTKRGTNQIHGNAFWEAYNSAFNANSYVNDFYLSQGNLKSGRKQPSHTNDFGGSIGGPIWKNKLFGFFNFEYENIPGTRLFTRGVLTQAAQAGTFTYTRADNGQLQTVSLLNIAAAKGFPSQINGAGANPAPGTIQSLLNSANTYVKNGTLVTNQTDPYLASLQQSLSWTAPTDRKNTYPTLRLDYQIKPNIAWHGSYNMYWRYISESPVYPGDAVQTGGFQSTYSTTSTGLDWTITPRLVNQANFGVTNTQEVFEPRNSFNAFQGITYLPSTPSFSNGGSAVLTPPLPDSFSVLPEPRNNPVWDITDNMTWTRGSHTFTFGGDLRISNSHDVGTAPPIAERLGITSLDPAAAMFNTVPVAGCTQDTQGCFPGGLSKANRNEALNDAEALYATLTGRVQSLSGSVPYDSASRTYKSNGITLNLEKQAVGGLYFQDSWKFRPHLAFNYGFRWQLSGAVVNTNNIYTSPTFADLFGPSKELFNPGTLDGDLNPQIAQRGHPYNGDYRQPAPNFGFAWNPDFENGILGKLMGGSDTVIRGGAAVSYYDEGWVVFENVATGPGLTQTVSLNSSQFTPGTIQLGGAIPTPFSLPPTANFPVAESVFTFNGVGFGTVDPKIRSPYIENWNLGIQRKIPGNTVLEISYVGNHSVHMWQTYDINEVNIFQNVPGLTSFLQDFKNAQLNYAASGGTTFGGPNSTPILTQAFSGAGAGGFTNGGFLFDVQTGQAGALADAIAASPTYFCNLVGNTFSPCVPYNNAAPAKAYPINFFYANPYAAGAGASLLSDPGSESYNGLQIQVKHPVGHGLTLAANYAYSHSFTNRYVGDYDTADSEIMNFTTLRNPGYNAWPSPYDLRQTLRAYFTYDLPFGTGRQFRTGNSIVNKVIGDWNVGSIFTWQTGRNFKLSGDQFTYNAFDSYSPGGPDSGVVLNGITVSQLQSAIGAFAGPNPNVPLTIFRTATNPISTGQVAPESTPGQLGQAVFLHGPMFINTDISITRRIPIYEHVNLNIHGELLNAFNHVNWSFNDRISGGTNNPAQYLLIDQSPVGVAQQYANRVIQFRMELGF